MLRPVTLLTTLIFVWSVQVGAASAANIAVLMPGSGGIVPGDFLVRNEARIKAAGIRTILTTSSATAAQTVAAEAAQGHKVVIVGMSKATLGTPDKLPATLVIHHSSDGCKFTLPSGATEFVTWARGKARLQWINTDGEPSSNPCNAQGAHGFFRQDGPAVSAAIAFIRSR
jgi:hypothetical protein